MANTGSSSIKQGSLFGSTTIIWEDANKGTNVMWRVPRNIRLNDNIVVREDEYAVFFRDGKVLAYIDRPDRYSLTSLNSPVVGGLVRALSGVQQQAEVYYLQRRFFDGKFGSKEPYVFRDPDFGLVSLRVFGEFRWRVSHPDNFISQFVGTLGASAQADVEDRLRDQMVLLVYAALGQAKDQGLRVTDLAAQLQTLEQLVLGKAPDYFDAYGLEINRLQGLSINLPDDVQKAVSTRSAMGVLGVNYIQYQAGQAMTTAAANPGAAGSVAGLGVGLGAGMGMGYGMMGQMGSVYGGTGQGPGRPCPRCGTMVPAGAKFCPSCGTSMEVSGGSGPAVTCPKCGAAVASGVKFCPNCGNPMTAPPAPAAAPPPPPPPRTCAKCQAALPPGVKFCPNCGAPA